VSDRTLDVPDEVRHKASTLGAEGERWLRRLPQIVRSLELEWEIELGGVMGGGSDSYVAEATTGEGAPAEKARWLADFIAATWHALDRPCSQRVVERALAMAASREAAFDPAQAVLVHGDAHGANTLRVPGTSEYRCVDPDGLFAEPACDLAVPMREWSAELLASGEPARMARERCARLSALTGVASQSIWEWGFVERVSTGLLALHAGQERVGTEMLAVAERLS
jgi:aminoglycoside phosphotransferase (APT) family kinase protein